MEIKNAKQSRRTYPAQEEFQFDSAKVRIFGGTAKVNTKFNIMYHPHA